MLRFFGGNYWLLEHKKTGQRLVMAVRGEPSLDDIQFADTTSTLVWPHRTFWDDFDFRTPDRAWA